MKRGFAPSRGEDILHQTMAVGSRQVEQRMGRLAERCRDRGLRLTHQRVEVFRALAASQEHPDAETLYRRARPRVAGLSLDTVYRTLAFLERLGLVRKADVVRGSVRWDANCDRHHHFVCTRCGLVRDVYSDELDRLREPEGLREIGQVLSSDVYFRGVCSACLRRRRRG